MMEQKKIKLLHERFFHLAQNILCDKAAAEFITNNALERLQLEYENKTFASNKEFIRWTQDILDRAIDDYFYKIINEIKANSKEAKEKLMLILKNRFSILAYHKVLYDEGIMIKEDAEDAVQSALEIVYKKCAKAKPKGLFIQWAQMILNNKYRELRRIKRRQQVRVRSLSQNKHEMVYEKDLGDVVRKSGRAKEVDSKDVVFKTKEKKTKSQTDPFTGDIYRSNPVKYTEYVDLKKRLLDIVKGMGNRCKKVFRVLFSEGDQKLVYQEFQDLTRNEIYVIVSRCRSRLKEEAIRRGIL